MYLKASTTQGASWVGIYKKGASNAWENVLLWSWVNEDNWIIFKKNSYRKALKFNTSYEARLFFNNSFHTEASKEFKLPQPANFYITIGANYHGDDFKGVTLDIISGYYLIKTDWVAIYKKGSKNIIQWGYVKFDPNIRGYILKLPSQYEYKKNEIYEAVIYENNTYRVITSKEFKRIF
jgi:hypothetical protein